MNSPKIELILKALRFEAGIYVGSSTSIVCEAAADLIEQLQQELIDERYRHDRYADFCVAQGEELSKLKAQQRWIPVTERLPEFAEDVLVVDTIGVVKKGMYIDDDTWLLEGGTLSTPYVRWWKNFPEPPKEE